MKVVDMHCDTISRIYLDRQQGGQASILENSMMVDLKKMKAGDYGLQNFALFTDLEEIQEPPFEYCMKLLDTFYRELEPWNEMIGIVKTYSDIEENWKQGRMSALLTIEEGGVCQGRREFLRDFYRLGVRMMTLTWNYPNELAWPNLRQMRPDGKTVFVAETERGLTPEGISFVREMEEMGMIIDISHLGDAGIWDVFANTSRPLVASHSNARALASHPRNLTDEMIRALAERGGVMGINFCASFLRDFPEGQRPYSYISDMVEHIKYIRNIGEIQCIGLGTDFDGISCGLEIPDASAMGALAREMERQGFTQTEIQAVFSDNVLRVYREILK